jgi:hypothetical protein
MDPTASAMRTCIDEIIEGRKSVTTVKSLGNIGVMMLETCIKGEGVAPWED